MLSEAQKRKKQSLQEVDLLWTHMWEYFGWKQEDKQLQQNLQDIANDIGEVEKLFEIDKHDYSANEEADIKETAIPRKLPYYQHFQRIIVSAVDSEEEETGAVIENPHFIQSLLEFFLKNYLPFFSMIGNSKDESL